VERRAVEAIDAGATDFVSLFTRFDPDAATPSASATASSCGT